MKKAALAALWCVVLTACVGQSDEGSRPSTDGSEAPSATASRTDAAGPPPPYTDLSTLGEDRLPAGDYALVAYGVAEEAPLPVITVPRGYQAFRGFSVGGAGGPGFWALMAWTVDTVYKNPCAAESARAAGSSARDLATALTRQDLTTATRPKPVRLSGYHGIYVEITAPTGRDFTRCGDAFNLWSHDDVGNRFLQAPGQVDRLWILDTPHDRIVLDATHTPRVPDERVRQLVRMVRSTRLVQPS